MSGNEKSDEATGAFRAGINDLLDGKLTTLGEMVQNLRLLISQISNSTSEMCQMFCDNATGGPDTTSIVSGRT